MIGADSTAVAWLVAVAEMIIAISFAASVIVVGRYLEAKRPAKRGSHRRWPDEPDLGNWPPPDPDEQPASTSDLVAKWEAGPEIREHNHDFLGMPCWCGWGEKIVPPNPGSHPYPDARPYTAAADWPAPAGPADQTDIIYQAGWQPAVTAGEAAADA